MIFLLKKGKNYKIKLGFQTYFVMDGIGLKPKIYYSRAGFGKN